MEDKLQKIVNQYIDDTDQQLEVINIMTEEIKKTQKKIVNMLEELISLTYEEKEKEIKNMEEQLLTSIGSVEKLESELKDVEEQERKERLESEAAERRAKLKEQEEAYKKKQDELKEIEQAVENQNAPQTPSTSSSSSGFTWPSASTYITSYYGWRYIFGSNSFHKGIDLAGPTGTAIYAAQDGVVTYTGYYGEYGNLIIIQHSDGYQTKYAHLSSYGVSTGQRVSKGQYIAGMGTTGLSTGPHLHFEILKDGSNRDPLAYLR